MSEQKITSYTGLRKDVISMIKGKPSRVLDVGCSNGILLEYLKLHWGVDYTVGVDFDEDFACEAAKTADKVFKADLDTFDWSHIQRQEFDLIVFADILEHTKNPEKVLSNALTCIPNGGQIIISLPNIQHWTAIANLLRGKWPQRERGLFDKTHLRFFTLDSIYKLADACGVTVDSILRRYRLLDQPNLKINRLSKLLAFPLLKPFLTYQYVVSMKV